MNKTDKKLSSLQFECNRYATFKKWIYDDTKMCNKQKMAEAGFYKYGNTREVDLVKCFLCGKEMDGWEEDDDPWQEHKTHASYCMFATIGKPESLMTLMEYLSVVHQLQINKIKQKYSENADILDKAVKKMEVQIKFSKSKQ